MTDLPDVLHRCSPPVLEAGRMIRAEFLRPDGPRGAGHKAAVDTEIELFLRDVLQSLLPARFVGEETEPVPGAVDGFCWLVDPHDGTSEFLQGARGSAVSVALLREGVPVLGLVHAPLSPDRGSDVIGWAEGMDYVLRNGAKLRPSLASRSLAPDEIVLLAYRSYTRPETNKRRVAPAQFVSSTSVAYRLARVAAGDGVATASRQSKLSAYDYAAGHALLRGAGGVLMDGSGRRPIYTPEGQGVMDKCFGGAPAAVEALLGRDWSLRNPPETPLPTLVSLDWPRREEGLDRAIGALAGLALCAPAEGTELAIALSRALLAGPSAVPVAYRSWPGRLADGAPLFRSVAYGIRCANPVDAARQASADARLTHADPHAIAVCAPLAAAVAAGVAGGDRAAMFFVAREAADEEAVRAALHAGDPGEPTTSLGLLRHGFFHLGHGTEIGALLSSGSVAGALIGAAEGRAALPGGAFLRLLGHRPARPSAYWAEDLPLLAEALLANRSQ